MTRDIDTLGIGAPFSSNPSLSGWASARSSEYYSSLIDWDDPADPLRRLVAPDDLELETFGSLDPSNESANTVAPGLQHKYRDTALLLVADTCAGYCRYCFRKRLFAPERSEALRDRRPALNYIRQTPQITDVLLTGGDPLTLSTRALKAVVDDVSAIPHVRAVRIGSKIPAFNPARITDDSDLLELIRQTVARGCSVHVMTHFDHPRELTTQAVEAIEMLRSAGATCLNQCPVTRGINDDSSVLAELFELTTAVGCPQYYLFQCRPTTGNSHFVLPLERAFEVVSEARARVSGLSRRARFCISHESGKIEIVGMDDLHVFARYHRAKDPSDDGRMLVYRRNAEAIWLDQLREAS
jgi:KamA family protein